MLKIYHNPRCSKSRQGLEILEESKMPFEIIKYLDQPPTIEELTKLVKTLDISPIQLIRKGEAVWKENYKGKTLTDTQIIEAMASHPKLIERPIVIDGKKAVIGRPPVLIKDLL